MALGIKYIAAKIEVKPAYGRIRTIIAVYSPPMDKPQVELPPEQVLSVNRLPDEAKGALDIKTNLLISAGGSVERCEAADGKFRAYANVACTQLIRITAPVLKNRSGDAVGYVTAVHTRFVKEGTQLAIEHTVAMRCNSPTGIPVTAPEMSAWRACPEWILWGTSNRTPALHSLRNEGPFSPGGAPGGAAPDSPALRTLEETSHIGKNG